MTQPEFDHPPAEIDELLSAYMDGEATVAERQLVEQALADSPELRSRMAEYREFKQMISTLPPIAAPLNLRADVLKQISATASSIKPPARIQSRSARGAARFSMRSLIGSVAVIIALAAVSAWNLGKQRDPLLATNDRVPDAASATVDLPVMTPAPREFDSSADGIAPMIESFDTSVAIPPVPGPVELPRAAEAPSIAVFSPPPAEGLELFGNQELLQRLLAPGQTPAIGELLSHIETMNDQPYIVTYSVLDVVEAFDDVQVLLQREGIRPLGSNARDAETWMKEIADVAKTGRTVAIFLEAPEAAVENVLNEIPVVLKDEDRRGNSDDAADSQPRQQSAAATGDLRSPADPGPSSSAVVDATSGPALQLTLPLDNASRKRLDTISRAEKNTADGRTASKAQQERDAATPPTTDMKSVIVILEIKQP